MIVRVGVFQATDDGHVAGGVHPGEVAGAIPPARGERPLVCLGVVLEAWEEPRAADLQLALLTRRNDLVVEVCHACLVAGAGAPRGLLGHLGSGSPTGIKG